MIIDHTNNLCCWTKTFGVSLAFVLDATAEEHIAARRLGPTYKEEVALDIEEESCKQNAVTVSPLRGVSSEEEGT